jgi:dynein heavy chain
MLESLGGKGPQGRKSSGAKSFTINNTTTARKGPSYYKDLYEFDAISELEEFQLPFMADHKNKAGSRKGPNQSKASSGVINSTQLAPIQQQAAEDMEPYGREMEDGDIIEEGDEMEGLEQENFEGIDIDSIDMEAFRAIIDNNEDAHKKQIMEVRTANFIRRGTYIHQVLHQILTGEQAISFFAKHGNATPIKFLNANRRPVAPDQFRPYDLEVIHDKKKLLGEYFTISAQGVVHICPEKPKGDRRPTKNDIVPTEFFSLSEWMQQSTLFNVLTSMKFFKHYIHTKVFNLWKGNVRYKMYLRTRESLSRSLIFSRPAFLGTYFQINQTLFEMQRLKTFTIPKSSSKQHQDIDDYLKEQRAERESVKNHYSDRVEEITKKLEVLVQQVNESRSLREEEDLEHTKMGQQAKNKSMVLQKKEDELKRRVMRLARINHQALGTFIRLTDYMILETLVKINQDSADLILKEMAKDNKDNKKCFVQTLVDFNDTGVFFNPAVTDVTEKFGKELEAMLNATAELTGVSQHSNFSQYVQGLISEPPQFREIVNGSAAYAWSKEAIMRRIGQDFDDLAVQAQKLQICRPVHKFEAEFRFETFVEENHDIDSIKSTLSDLAAWEGLVAGVTASHTYGLIMSNSRKLKDKLSKKVEQERKNVKGHLTKLAEEKIQDMKKRLKRLGEKLEDPKEKLEEYV